MTAIRRVAVTRRIERKELPEPQSGALRPIEKGHQLVTEIANAVAARKGRGMKQHAGEAANDHPWASALMASFSPSASKCCSHRLAADDPLPAFAAITGRMIL